MDKPPELLLLGKDEYLTVSPTVYQWKKGEVWFRIVIPPGQNTDLMSSPKPAAFLGFRKEDPKTWRAAKVHDFLCHRIRYAQGMLPSGTYQWYYQPAPKGEADWKDCHSVVWTYREADALFEKILTEDGFPEGKARLAYLSLRRFGWLHRLFNK